MFWAPYASKALSSLLGLQLTLALAKHGVIRTNHHSVCGWRFSFKASQNIGADMQNRDDSLSACVRLIVIDGLPADWMKY